MSKHEIEVTRYGKLCDLIACYAIGHGAKEKPKKRKMSISDALELR